MRSEKLTRRQGPEDTRICEARMCQRDIVRTEVTPNREWTVGFTPKAAIWFNRRVNEATLEMIEYMVIPIVPDVQKDIYDRQKYSKDVRIAINKIAINAN
jgi:hypothetical protein